MAKSYALGSTERIAARIVYTNRLNARCILEHTNGSALYTYEQAGKFLVIAFWGSSAKPMFHYSYRTDLQRFEKIEDFKRSVEQSVALRQEQKAKRAAAVNTFKVGDIVNTSWGYDQTNVDFYVVTRVSAACVWVRPIAQDYEATGFMSGKCWPKMPIEMAGPETRHVCRGNSFSINGHGAHLTTGDCHSSSYA